MKLLRHLSRITAAGKGFIPQIDGLRFVAILAVIAFHARGTCLFYFTKTTPGLSLDNDLVNRAFMAGHFGVHLFFAISGFILSLPFAREYLAQGKPVRLRDYFIRRITRIEPPYIIHLAFLFLLSALVLRHLPSHPYLYGNPNWASYAGAHILASLVYINEFIYGTHPYPNIVLWSLEVEVQFYILAPFLARLFHIQPTALRRAAFVALIVLLPLPVQHWGGTSYLATFSLLGNIQYFLAGFLLADLYLAGWLKTGNQTFKWDLLVIPALLAVVFIDVDRSREILLPWVILVGCIAAFRGKLSAGFLSNPWITTIGGMCYTIYMYHVFLLSLIIRVTLGIRTSTPTLDLIIQFLIMTTLIIPISAVLFVLFERPFMQKDWPAKFWAAIRSRL